MTSLGIISNPYAKLNKRKPGYNTRLCYTLDNKGEYHITRNLEDLDDVCQEFAEKSIKIIGIVGGDGSLGLSLTKIYTAYTLANKPLPKIIPLRGGTMNFLASNLGLFKDPHEILEDLLSSLKNRHPLFEQPIQTLMVEDRIGFVFACGLATEFLSSFYQNKSNSFGAGLALTKFVLNKITSLYLPLWNKKINCEISCQFTISNKAVINQENFIKLTSNKGYSLIMASTVPKLPLNLHLFKNVKMGAPEAELIAINGGLPAFLATFSKILTANKLRKISNPLTHNINSAEIIFSKDNYPYSLDGDIIQNNQKIKISLGPTFIFCSPYNIPRN